MEFPPVQGLTWGPRVKQTQLVGQKACRKFLQLSRPHFSVCKKWVFGGSYAKNRAWHVMLILPIISSDRCKTTISLQE